jgi:mannitol operon transcriptional antiterminator
MFDLDNEISLLSMDHDTIQVKRILLMLAPDNLSDSEQQLLSMVSSMIIMSDSNLNLFTNGNQEQIKDALADLFLDEIKKGLTSSKNIKA